MTYDDAIEYLYGLQQFGTKLGLDNIRRLASLCGDPHRALRFIHVAGTNGKGSTCAMLESVYRKSGLRVGLFTSPHLISFRERIQINRNWIAPDELVRRVEALKAVVETNFTDASNGAAASHPTFFECVTLIALLYFRDARCDLVVWETGMGGRLDATNIVTPLASVITNVGLDHQAWLGESITEVTGEKAGIIKEGIPVVTAATLPEVVELLRGIALERGAPFHLVDRPESGIAKDDVLPALKSIAQVPLPGAHQRINAALAAATVRVLDGILPVSDQDLVHGLETVSWSGRLQIVRRGEGVLILDGAHNPAGAAALADTLDGMAPPNTSRTLILGILEDKDIAGITRALAPSADRIEAVPVQSLRSAVPDRIADSCRSANPGASIRTHASLEKALAATRSHPHVVVTGSLYLVGEAMVLLGLNPTGSEGPNPEGMDERGLNEWSKPSPEK